MHRRIHTPSFVACPAFQLNILGSKLESLWSECQGCVVLFTWFSDLQEETTSILGMETDEDGAVVVDVSVPVKAEMDKKMRLW